MENSNFLVYRSRTGSSLLTRIVRYFRGESAYFGSVISLLSTATNPVNSLLSRYLACSSLDPLQCEQLFVAPIVRTSLSRSSPRNPRNSSPITAASQIRIQTSLFIAWPPEYSFRPKVGRSQRFRPSRKERRYALGCQKRRDNNTFAIYALRDELSQLSLFYRREKQAIWYRCYFLLNME